MTMKERLAALPVIGTVLAVQKRTKADAADQFGAAIAFHGFISLFPLVAVAVAITGWLLADQPALVADVVDAIQRAIPGLETAAVDNVLANVIDNAGSIGLIGFLGALYTGMRITNAAQTATQFVFGVRLEDVSAVKARAQQLGSLAALGLLAIAGVAASAWVQSAILSEFTGALGALIPAGGLLLSAVLDTFLFWLAYRIYSLDAGVASKALLPGALLGGFGWTALKYFGGNYLARQADNSVVTGDGTSATALLLGTMIGLLLLFYLAGRLYVYGAELSAELAGFGVRPAIDDDDEPEAGEREEGDDDAPVEHASGDRSGLLAALEAHEQRRGVAPPTPPSESAGDADTDVVPEAGPDEDAAGEPPADGTTTAPAAPADAPDAAPADAPEGVGEDDLVVTIGHRPDGDDGAPDDATGAGTASPAPAGSASTRDDAGRSARETHATWAQRPEPMTRELVPFSPPDIATTVAHDPAARRIAIAAAVGLVGIAAGVLRRRRG